MGSIDLSSVRSCWGNSNFDYVHSDSVGNSGGILCIWDPNSFRRSSFTRSDYFVIVRGVWLKSGIDLMIVVVYAPQEAKEKRMLWDYLAHVSNQWVGKLVMMGDFNEVRYKSDRYGSNFNAHDAEIFNSFIYNAGLDEVPLGGSAYTWCLKSASKMSKLDRFFVSENLLSMCPNITAITLERFISDHRPILLREVRYDYGPIPFRFYRYWLEVDGFDKLVRDSWNVAPVNKKNAIRNFMGKLKFLKDRIRSWLSIHRSNSRGEIYFLKEELRSCDEIIDKRLLKEDMEARISKRRLTGLWGIAAFDKSPGPDGFSFSFYRYFLHVIEKDVFEAVDYFFMYGENTDWICNSKFIALILNLDANMVNGSSSISLIAVLIQDYCLKYWANRLVVVLLDLGVNVEDGMVKNAGLSKRGVSCPLDSISDYMGTKVGVNMSRKLSLEWKWWTKCVICLSDGDETPFIARENSLFLSRVVVFGSMQIFHSPIFKYVRFELNKNAMLASKLNAFKFDISFRSKEREVDIEEMQLNSLVKFLGMTTLVPCEEVLRTWTFEKVIGRSFRWLNFERD
ncbi:RNA-directed DNA polymerase, eukaryota [Tanacetum coccineum]